MTIQPPNESAVAQQEDSIDEQLIQFRSALDTWGDLSQSARASVTVELQNFLNIKRKQVDDLPDDVRGWLMSLWQLTQQT